MLETQPDIGTVTIVTAGHTLALATAELRKSPASPHRSWEFQTALWNLNRHAMGVSQRDVVVADCPWTEDEMKQFRGLGVTGSLKRLAGKLEPDFGLWLPEVASTAPEGLALLSKVYPSMGWDGQKSVLPSVRNVDARGKVINLFGWLRTEAAIKSPSRGSNELEARATLLGRGRRDLTLNVYADASHQSKLLSRTNQYLDEVSAWVRVLSSRVRDRVVYAGFGPFGGGYVTWGLGPGVVGVGWGVRSVGVSGKFKEVP